MKSSTPLDVRGKIMEKTTELLLKNVGKSVS